MAEHAYIITQKDQHTLLYRYDVPSTIRDRKEVKYPSPAAAEAAFARHQFEDSFIVRHNILDLNKVTAIVFAPNVVNVMFSLKNQRKLFNFSDKTTGRSTWLAHAHERKIRIVDNTERILFITMLINDSIMKATEHTMSGTSSSIIERKDYHKVMAQKLPNHFVGELVRDGSAVLINCEAVVMFLEDCAGINVIFGGDIILRIRADSEELLKCRVPAI